MYTSLFKASRSIAAVGGGVTRAAARSAAARQTYRYAALGAHGSFKEVGRTSFQSSSYTTFARGAPRGNNFDLVPLPAALENVSSKVLDDQSLARALGPHLFDKFQELRNGRGDLTKAERNEVARHVREWAQRQGAVAYAHWFSPVRGATHALKLETFVALDFATNDLIVDMSGTELFQTETDGSSFPNGGLRVTHNAAAYMSWDTASPLFVHDGVLHIPAAFVSWTGESLDYKTPLLRANEAVNQQSLRMLRHLGDTKTERVLSNVGWEQEFFVVDRDSYLARPDLMACQRTLFGAPPLRGQEHSGNYFARIDERTNRFLREVRDRLWELGVSIDCVHNEVAPAQHEFSPIFSLTSHAADTNVLSMDMLRQVAMEHNLAVLCHEKPFSGINGNGKHNNWGLNTDSGANLYVPGNSVSEQRRFAAFVAAVTRAVHKHGDLLRIGCSTSGNDHRLGAQEAPPAIFTLYMGEALEAHLRAAAAGGDFHGYMESDKMIEVTRGAPAIKAAAEDRNRTAPLPWCGNRFELRAVGGNQHIAWPLTMLTAAVADSLRVMADQVDAGANVNDVIRATLQESAGALFHGNGYDAELLEALATKEGLFHLKTTPAAYAELTSAKNVEVFEKLNIFSARELSARIEIAFEEFWNDISVEARTALHMLRSGIVPACLQSVRDDAATGIAAPSFDKKRALVETLLAQTEALEEVWRAAPADDARAAADYAAGPLRDALNAVRTTVDALEERVDGALWPYPSVQDLVHQHH